MNLTQNSAQQDQSKISHQPWSGVQITVRNSGVNIEPEQLSKIFEPFYRILSNDPWKHGGTGLGLALVKKLVEHIEGVINVSNSQGWITFTLQLPLSLSA
jgi:signal transduction histidine kinase